MRRRLPAQERKVLWLCQPRSLQACSESRACSSGDEQYFPALRTPYTNSLRQCTELSILVFHSTAGEYIEHPSRFRSLNGSPHFLQCEYSYVRPCIPPLMSQASRSGFNLQSPSHHDHYLGHIALRNISLPARRSSRCSEYLVHPGNLDRPTPSRIERRTSNLARLGEVDSTADVVAAHKDAVEGLARTAHAGSHRL